MSETRPFNDGWLFYYGDAPDADYMGFDDRAWRRVTLPHDWAVAFPFDKKYSSGTGYLPGGRGWYRKHFNLSQEDLAKRMRLVFGGVYKHARVWVNSNYLGAWAYGYTAFSFDLTPFVRPGENVVSVRVEHDEVADSRWYTGSGIYRDVSLVLTHPDALKEHGLFVRTLSANEKEAVLRVEFESGNADGFSFGLFEQGASFPAAAGKISGKRGFADVVLQRPRLWSPEIPSLYTLVGDVMKNGEVLDRETLAVGVREARFDPDEGFFLNGKPMKIKGVCLHHDGGCLGAAVPPAVWERRLGKLKACGVNAVRTAHNPPDEAFIALCDRLGLFVMEEAFDEWEGCKNKWWQGHNVYPPKRFGYAEDFPQWHEKDLSSMVKRDRNHPSVILWSIGNEIDYPNDPYVTPYFGETLGNNDAGKPREERRYDPKKPDASRLPEVSRRLVSIVHALDPSRPVLCALSFPELSNRTGLADTTDVTGYNYRERFYDGDHADYPDRIILGSENGHDPAAWYAVEERDFVSSQFLWTGSDFLGECRGWPVRVSGAGLLDLAGFEKPLYYRRKALWTKEPFVKLALQPDADRGVWADAFVYARPGGNVCASAYTNEKEAELFLNGRSLGKKTLSREDGCRVSWVFPYEAGELRVVTPLAEDRLCTPGAAAKLELTAVNAEGDCRVVEVCLRDADGNLAAADDRELTFAAVGMAALLGVENGAPDDLTPYASPSRFTKNGRAVVYLRVWGEAFLHARTADGSLKTCLALGG